MMVRVTYLSSHHLKFAYQLPGNIITNNLFYLDWICFQITFKSIMINMHAHTHICKYTHAHMNAHTHTHFHVLTHVHMYAHIWVHTCRHKHIHMYACTHPPIHATHTCDECTHTHGCNKCM